MNNQYLEKIAQMEKEGFDWKSILKPTFSVVKEGPSHLPGIHPYDVSLAREHAREMTNKYMKILGPTLKKINSIKDPYERIAISSGHY